jgi:hypothetical protein
MMEFQIDLMEAQAANDFMGGPAFAKNPIGERFDPDALVLRYEEGKPVDDLIFRSDQAESHGHAYARNDQTIANGTANQARG